MFILKRAVAAIFELFQLNEYGLHRLNKQYDRNYIRIVNYHDTPIGEKRTFEKQMKWYKKRYEDVTAKELELFLQKKKSLTDKPGLMITFDDGLEGNAYLARELLNKYGFTGYFFVSSDLIGKTGYMSLEQLKTLQSEGHVIGCHTATHYRMQQGANKEKLSYEIMESKKKLEKLLDREIIMFCWCGGEEQYYTKAAADMIKHSGYKYSFMTNSFPVIPETDHFQLQRINVESSWPVSLVKFQVSSWMDMRFAKKRNRVNRLTS